MPPLSAAAVARARARAAAVAKARARAATVAKARARAAAALDPCSKVDCSSSNARRRQTQIQSAVCYCVARI